MSIESLFLISTPLVHLSSFGLGLTWSLPRSEDCNAKGSSYVFQSKADRVNCYTETPLIWDCLDVKFAFFSTSHRQV
jgi:hypothetical protein